MDYTCLPGIINERLFSYLSENTKIKINDTKIDCIQRESFINKISTMFIGSVNEKMQFSFRMYDYDGDGKITKNDVKLMMSYLPFKNEEISDT